jgi:hypothetical protein
VLCEPALDRERSPHRALCVILVRRRIAEISEYFAPAALADHAAMMGQHSGGAAAKRANDLGKVLRVGGQPAARSRRELGGERGDVAPLRRSWWRARRSWQRFRSRRR